MFLRLLRSFQLVTNWVFFTGQLKAFKRSSDPTIHQNNAFLCALIFDYGFWQGPTDSDKGSLCVDTRLRARSCMFGIQRPHNGSVYLSEKNTPAVILTNTICCPQKHYNWQNKGSVVGPDTVDCAAALSLVTGGRVVTCVAGLLRCRYDTRYSAPHCRRCCPV